MDLSQLRSMMLGKAPKDADDFVVVERSEANGSMSQESQRTVQQVKDWLNPTDSDSPASEYRKHLRSHAQGTGEWIFETTQYRDWSQSESIGNLWIRGIPGCGKSVVAANLTSRLQRFNHNRPVLFFFFREIIQANRSPRSLLQDFCFKLLAYSPYLQSALKQLRQDFPDVGSVPFGKLWECLATSLQSMEKVYCIVDALDEMERDNDEWLEDFLNLGRQYPQSIKLIVTSRQVPHVEKHMSGSSLVDLRLDRRRVDQDISTFVTQRLEQTQLDLPPTEVEEIAKAICERGKGLFLYTKLMLEELLQNPVNMYSRVHNLPEGLGDMYTNLLREHATRSGTTAEFQRLVLEWITHSARPLRLLELAAMIESLPDRAGLDPECNVKDVIRNTCGPLLEVCEDGVVQIIHHSLTEFILNRDVEHTKMANEKREIAAVDSTTVHGMIARTCIQYLTNGCLQKWAIGGHRANERKNLLLQFYFLRYAVMEWPFHVARAGGSNAELLQQLEHFSQDADQSSNQDYEAWNQLWRTFQDDVPIRCSILHVTAYAGLDSFARYLLSRGSNPDTKDKDGRTPLEYAVMKGNHEMVRILLQHGASHDVKVDKSSSGQGKSLIYYACKLNRVSVLHALIQGGADPMAKELGEGGAKSFDRSTYLGDSPWYKYPRKTLTAFALACQNGESEAVCELIKLVDPSCLCEGQPLHLAAKGAKHEIVSALLKHEQVRLTINDLDDDGNTPVYLAARTRNAQTVRALLDHGADVNTLSLNRNFPPEPRIQDENKIKAKPSPSYTPLHAWALGIPRGDFDHVERQDMIETLDLLLNAGCDINAKDHRGRTVLFEWPGLHWADMSAMEFVTALLERGADATVVDNDGATPLHSTKLVAQAGVLKALINAGCDINAQRKHDGLTALMCTAMQQNHTDPALFHELKADFHRQDWLGNTALHHNFMRTPAGEDRFPDTWLIHSNLSMQNHLGRTPLHEFIYRLGGEVKGNKKKVFEALLKMINHGASLESRDGCGRTALLVALVNTRGDSLKLVEELLRLGANAQATDYEGKSALHYAFRPYRRDYNGHVAVKDVARCLIEAGASMQVVDHEGNTVLHDLISNEAIFEFGHWPGFEKQANIIIELGCPHQQTNYKGRTVLHIAATVDGDPGYSGQGKVMTRLEFLLQPSMHFDVNARDNDGITALHLASAISDVNALTLIQHGADVEIKDYNGRIPLHFAAEAGQSNVVGLLTEIHQQKSIPIDQRCAKRRSALHRASRSGNSEAVKLLLGAGANPSLIDERGRTALHAVAEFKEQTHAQRSQARYDVELPFLMKSKSRSNDIKKDPWLVRDALSRMELEISEEDDVGDIRQVVRYLLAAGSDPHQTDDNGHRPSDVAVMLRCFPVVDELKHSVYGPVLQALSPLHESPMIMSDSQIQELVESIHVPVDQVQFLEQAFATCNERLVEELVRCKGLKLVEEGAREKKSGLFRLANLGLTSMMERLLPYVENVADLLPSLMEHAAKRSLCNLEMVKLLVKQSTIHPRIVSEEGLQHVSSGMSNDMLQNNRYMFSTSLIEFSAGRHWWHPRALSILLGARIDVEASLQDATGALQNALSPSSGKAFIPRHKWNNQTLETLLKHGADPNSVRQEHDWAPLTAAIRGNCDIETIQLLIKHGASLHNRPENPINSAIYSRNLAVLEMLLKAGADPNSADRGDHYPLLQAGRELRSGLNDTAMSLLLKYGADPHRLMKDGSTVFHEICGRDYPVQPCLASGIDLEIQTNHGCTPLMCATKIWWKTEERSTAIDLIEAGANIHAVDYSGNTPLHHAVIHGNVPITKLLLKRSASVSIRNNEGCTPLSDALSRYTCGPLRRRWYTIIDLLLSAGSNPLDVLADGRTALHCIATVLMDSSNIDREAQIKEDGGEDQFSDATNLYQIFLDAGCDRETRDNKGNTPIFYYVNAPKTYSGDDYEEFAPTRPTNPNDYAKMFSEHDIHKTNNDGDTLLHVIAGREESPCDSDEGEGLFKALVDLGLSPWKENSSGKTALDVAASQEKTKILALFARDE